MRRILFICLVISFCKCKNHSRFEWLLKEYESISFDTLKVFSSDKPEDKLYPFRGKRLDSTSIKLFPREISAAYAYDSGYYACFKFRIDSSRIGLITRTPSEYIPSSIKLLIFDERADSILNYMELAELFGDAGDAMDKSSFLFKDKNKIMHCFIWQQNSHDNSVDNPKDTAIDLSNYYYLITLSRPGIDTISTDSASLSKRFYGLLKE